MCDEFELVRYEIPKGVTNQNQYEMKSAMSTAMCLELLGFWARTGKRLQLMNHDEGSYENSYVVNEL